jgi:hypothetical protein
MSPGGLTSHINDVGEPSRLLIDNATLVLPNTIGVHPNEWSTLQGYYNTKTKRVMGFGGLKAHIYDVNESCQPHHTERPMILWSYERGMWSKGKC